MRPIDLLGIDLCEQCRGHVEIATLNNAMDIIRSYYCAHGIEQDAAAILVYATSDPCTMVDWKQCRLNPANQAGA